MNKKIAKYLTVTMMAASYAVLPQISSADVMAATTSERVNYAPVDNFTSWYSYSSNIINKRYK